MNLFYQNTGNHFSPILFNNEMVYLQYDALQSFLQHNINASYREILAKPFVSNHNINWYTSQEGKFAALDAFAKTEKTDALIKYHLFIDEIKTLSATLIASAEIEKNNWGNLLSQIFNTNNNIVFYNGADIVLLWGWIFNTADENYLPEEAYKNINTNEANDQEIESLPISKAVTYTTTQLPKKIIVRSNKKSLGFWYYFKKMWWVPIVLLLLFLALYYFLKPINCCNYNLENNKNNTSSNGFPTSRPPIDKSKIINDPNGGGRIISNLINIALKDKSKSIEQFANDLKTVYPEPNYKIVYFDTTVARLQFTFPDSLRANIKNEIKGKFQNYDLLIWDESIFVTNRTFNDPALLDGDKSWYFSAVKAQQAWDITIGDPSITVAVVDCGFDLKHPDFNKKIVHPYNVITKDSAVYASPSLTHGTHVAGIALANNNNGIGTSGIAPGCSLMPIQISRDDGLFSISDVIDGVLYAIKHNANVINLSLGKEISNQIANAPAQSQQKIIDNSFKDEELFWKEVFAYADKQNVTIVAAAGNYHALVGLDPMQRSETVIKVSASDVSNQKANYSNFGPLTTICAPGSNIYNCFPNNSYKVSDGTSMASPVVAGAVALMKSVSPNLSNSQIIQILKSTGKPIGNGNAGSLIQIDKAVAAAKSMGHN
jgi:subtilisin family serine protease